MTWSPPVNAGTCCNQYHVMTSNGTIANISTTSFTVSQDNSYISVSCMDQIGTLGPAVVYSLNIGMLFCVDCVGYNCCLATPCKGGRYWINY